jgi:hypothetical protein
LVGGQFLTDMGPQFGHDRLVVPLAGADENWMGLRWTPDSTAIGSQVLRRRPPSRPRMTDVALVRYSTR